MTPPLTPPPPLPAEVRHRADLLVTIYLVASGLALATLIVVVVILVIRVSSVASANHANAVTACQEANADRAEDVSIWESVLTLPPDATAAQRTTVARELAKVRHAYAPRDCAALYPSN